MSEKKVKEIVTYQDEQKIRKILCYPLSGAMPHCPARDRRKMRKFESMGDFSHSGDDHVCAKCRCGYVAGFRTWYMPKARGFWGEDLAHCGTYGVGFCHIHTMGCHNKNWFERAVSMKRLLQQQGESEKLMAPVEEMKLELIAEGEKAQTGIEMRTAMLHAHEFLVKFAQLANDGEDMTESSKDGPIPMSDNTRFKLAATLTTAAAKVAGSKWKIEQTSMMHKDEVVKRLRDTYLMTEKRVDGGLMSSMEEFHEGWCRELQVIWSDKGI